MGSNLNASAYAFNRGQQLSMDTLAAQKQFGYAQIDAQNLKAASQAKMYDPVYTTINYGQGHPYVLNSPGKVQIRTG
jgi:hypothetical protein